MEPTVGGRMTPTLTSSATANILLQWSRPIDGRMMTALMGEYTSRSGSPQLSRTVVSR